MSKSTGVGLAVLALALCTSRPAQADLQFAGDAPRVISVEARGHSFNHELQLGLGVLPLDAFYVGAAVAGSYTYHFSEIWAWEVAHGVYSYNIDTNLRADLESFGAQPSSESLQQINMLLSTNLLLKPLAGKLALFNRGLLQSETLFAVGVGAALTTEEWRFAVDGGIGMRFWASEAIAVRLDVRDYLIFDGFVPSNTLFLLLSGSLNFGISTTLSSLNPS